MTRSLLGIGASPGRAVGTASWVRWEVPRPPHRTITPEEVAGELGRFEEARTDARERIAALRDETAREVGSVEAKIFEPQILMLDDPDLVEGTISYIRDNYLSAERAFDWRILELRSMILDAAHFMIVDRLADLQDIRARVLSRLAGVEEWRFDLTSEPTILLLDELTPSFAVRLDPSTVMGVITAGGTRAAHSAVLTRSMHIPSIVGVGSELHEIQEDDRILMDGRNGQILVNPGPSELEAFERVRQRLSHLSEQTEPKSPEPAVTSDGQIIHLRANLDQPHDAKAARWAGAEGIGLFRSEFLVIGRRVIPSEDEQYAAYSSVVEAFPDHPVTLRTFDIGGDKFPLFLDMPPEENPYLGWRAIRVCLDLPDLFRNQLRAAVRAAGSGNLRILLPFIVTTDEIRRTQAILDEVMAELALDPTAASISLGIMGETPAAIETLDLIAPLIDFVSLGSNDLTQYVLAVDRGNARLSHLSDPLHPAMLRYYVRLARSAATHGLDLAVCSDLATEPVGLGVLIGLGYRDFSLPPYAIPEVREIVQAISADELARICAGLGTSETAGEIRAPISLYLEEAVPFETAPSAQMTVV